jgi:hypothetical protein
VTRIDAPHLISFVMAGFTLQEAPELDMGAAAPISFTHVRGQSEGALRVQPLGWEGADLTSRCPLRSPKMHGLASLHATSTSCCPTVPLIPFYSRV